MNVLFSFKVELCVDNTSVTNVVKVEVGLIVVDMDVEVWTMAVDILSPLNVVLDGVPLAVDVMLCSFKVVMYDVDVANADSIMTIFIIDNSRIVIFTKIIKYFLIQSIR